MFLSTKLCLVYFLTNSVKFKRRQEKQPLEIDMVKKIPHIKDILAETHISKTKALN